MTISICNSPSSSSPISLSLSLSLSDMASLLSLSNFITAAAVLLPPILAFLTYQIIAAKLQGKKSKKKYPPVAGTVFNQLLNFPRLHHYMTDLAAKYRTYRLLGPFRNEVYTSDPANVEYILKTNFENFGKGDYNYSILSDLLGDGIFTVDGDTWKQQRKVSSYEFSTKVLRDFSSVIFKKNAAKLANIISEAATSGQTMDMQDLFMKSTLDSIFKVGFGAELDSVCGSSEGAKFSRAFDDSSAMTLWRYVDIFWKIKKALNIGSEAEIKKNVKIIDDFVYKLIHSRAEQMNMSGNDSSPTKEDILSRFLHVNEMNPKYLRDIILNFIIAGKDTTATTLSWFIYLLCKHPDVQEKVAQEIKEATNSKEVRDFAQFATSISEEALEKMQYLHAALSETLRLYPAVPADAKLCFSDDTLPDGNSVRKGDMVVYQPYAMGRMKFLWGDDAEEFRPERWLDENGTFRPESPFKFTAFQAGPRICLGKDFAYRQMKIYSAVLLTFFAFKLSDDTKAVKYRTMINLHVDEGLHVRAFHRLPQL
ncbi:cytochrome P450 704C1-like [Diospyros lotus]|uniref:cytochrome P450 704C1-like n=1 Tax=Diospyros lotus TaxID=55363 RepID=UPI002254BB07|nr:cytochrome P450 704C1-like [Diospyros lotus]